MERKEKEIFKKYLPKNSVDYCFHFWENHRIQFTISAPRKGIYGNYKFRDGIHHISVNGNLNPEAFLVTYLHEVAHLLVRTNHRGRVLPHGNEWKSLFRQVLLPMIEAEVFRDDIRKALINHLNSPKATSCSDPVLHGVLMHPQEHEGEEKVVISNIVPLQLFEHEGMVFQLKKKLRTRFECIEISTGRTLLFSGFSRVIPMEKQDECLTTGSSKLLQTIREGDYFFYQGSKYQVMQHRRTRSVCRQVATGSLFLFSQSLALGDGEN